MSDTQLYLGLDLDPEYTQLSYYNVDTREPESVYHKEARDTYMLPNIMFYSAYNKKSDDGQSEAYKFIDLAGWCAGAKASACRFEENGTVVDQVYERTLRNENIEVAGRNYKAGDLLVKMMILHIRQFTEQFEGFVIKKLTVTVADTDPRIIAAVRGLKSALRLKSVQKQSSKSLSCYINRKEQTMILVYILSIKSKCRQINILLSGQDEKKTLVEHVVYETSYLTLNELMDFRNILSVLESEYLALLAYYHHV